MRFVSLTDGQTAILKAFEAWFDECPEPPSMKEVADKAGVSRGLVWQNVGLFEALGYVAVSRDVNGRIKKRGVLLVMALGEEDL